MTPRSFLISTFLSISLLSPVIHADDESTTYLAASEDKEIATKEGEKVTIYGISKDSSKSASGTNYVNFAGTDFHLVTFASDLDQFPDGEPHAIYNEKRIAIDGVISIYQGKPQIKLTSPGQVTFLTADEKFPPVKAEPEEPAKPEPDAMEKAPLTPQNAAEEEPRPKPPVDPKLYFK